MPCKTPKKFRLRRANKNMILLFQKNFRLRRAFIIFKSQKAQNFRGFYYSQNFFSKFSEFLLFLEEGGGLLLLDR